MKIFATFFFVIFIFLNSFAQVKFQRTYKIFGESSAGWVVPTNDGTGYFFGIGTVDSTITQYDFCIAKMNLYGDTLWTKTYGGGGNNGFAQFYENYNGNLTMIGNCYGWGSGSSDIYVSETNPIGDTLWTKTIGNMYYNIPSNSLKTNNGDFVILAAFDSLGFGLYDNGLIKIDSSGNILWNKIYGGVNDDELTEIIQSDDKGFILSGSTNTYGVGDYDTFVICTDSLGNILWAKTYGGPMGEGGSSIVHCSDGYVIANATNGFGQGGYDIYLIKIDFNGNLIWAKTYGTTIDEAANAIKQTTDKGFVIGGFYGIVTGDRGEMLMKIDSMGSFQWAKKYGSPVCNDDFSSFNLTNDGGFIISGSSCSFGGWNSYIIKTDSLGSSGCNEQNLNLITQDITSLLTVTNPTPNVTVIQLL